MDTEDSAIPVQKLRHICEVCGKDEDLTSEQGFEEGWDYPPRMGPFGIVSPRTCGNCTVNGTLWWSLVVDQTPVSDLSDRQTETLHRIMKEPASISTSKERS